MSNLDIVRNVTAELATRTKAQVTGWRWADGVVVFPDIRCPYCKQGVRSPAIWKHNDTHLVGQVVPQMGVTPQLEKPSHAHVTTKAGGICFGKARTAYQALFGALNGTPQYEYMVGPFLRGPLMGHHHCEEMDAVKDDPVYDDPVYFCYACEDELNEDDVYWFNDDRYCDDCFNEVAFNCWNCEGAYSNEYSNLGPDECNYCNDCWNSKFFKCEKCDTVGRRHSSYDTPDGSCCEDCYSDNYFGCENCGETTANKDRADYGDEALCQTCFNANYTTCLDCDEVYKDNHGHDCTEAKADDWDEDTLNEADEVVRLLAEDDPDNKLLARVRVRTYHRYLEA